MHMYRRITSYYEYVMSCLIKTEQVFVSGAHGFGGTTPPCCPALNKHTYFTILQIVESAFRTSVLASQAGGSPLGCGTDCGADAPRRAPSILLGGVSAAGRSPREWTTAS